MRVTFYLILLMFALGCGNKGTDPVPDPDPATDPVVDLSPKKAVLVFPAQNEICWEGVVVSEVVSKVNFKWNPAENAESYQLVIRNLSTDQSVSHHAAAAQLEVPLSRKTPFSWKVISISSKSKVVAESDAWNFYNSGPGVTSYAPFPAAMVYPLAGQTVSAAGGKMILKWTGQDPDGDVLNYDVHLGSANPELYQAGVTASTLEVTVVSGARYYWKIVTRDVRGNTSDSAVLSFWVN